MTIAGLFTYLFFSCFFVIQSRKKKKIYFSQTCYQWRLYINKNLLWSLRKCIASWLKCNVLLTLRPFPPLLLLFFFRVPNVRWAWAGSLDNNGSRKRLAPVSLLRDTQKNFTRVLLMWIFVPCLSYDLELFKTPIHSNVYFRSSVIWK